MMKKALILINKLSENPTTDELDVLEQARVVEEAFIEIGYTVSRDFFDLNLQRIRDLLVTMNPDIVFNLVEGVEGKAELIYFPLPCWKVLTFHIPAVSLIACTLLQIRYMLRRK